MKHQQKIILSVSPYIAVFEYTHDVVVIIVLALCNSLCLHRTKSYLPPSLPPLPTHQVMSIKDTGSENSHATQKLLYTTIRRGCEGLGVEIARPEALYDIIPSHMKSQFPPTPSSSASASPLPPLPPSVPPTLRSPFSISLHSPDVCTMYNIAYPPTPLSLV